MQALQRCTRAPVGLPRAARAGQATQRPLAHISARRVACRAEGDAEALPGALTVEDARGVLGVGASASFDDILNAKNRKLSDADDDGRLKVRRAARRGRGGAS